MKADFFKGVKQWDFNADGFQGKLPCFYYDTTSITAIFSASTKKVKPLLPKKEMTLLEILPGRCMVAFTAFEYRQTDIDPYNELSIAFPITYNAPQIPSLSAAWQMVWRNISAYVWQLPVTTEIARKGGVDMYGYPKFIAEIIFEEHPDSITCYLRENGDLILSITGRVFPTRKEKTTRFTTYSVIDDVVLKANIFINPIKFAQSRAKNAVDIGFGTHEIAETLKGLELSKSPVMYQYSPLNQGILFPGRNLMDN